MFLENLELLNYRNFQKLNLAIENSPLVLVGANGEGKTNLLEAIYFAVWGSSFRRSQPNDQINWAADTAKAEIKVKDQSGEQVISAFFKRDLPKVQLINHKKVAAKKELQRFGLVFYFSPRLEKILTGPPLFRRLVIDRILSQVYANYPNLIANYHKLVRTKNFLLKKGTENSLNYWEEQIVRTGSEIVSRRLWLVKRLGPALTRLEQEISGQNGASELRMGYVSNVLTKEEAESLTEAGPAKIQDIFWQKILAKREWERRLKQALVGPHKDEFFFWKNGRDSRFFASEGEGLRMMLALKLVHLDLLAQKTGQPVILLDDLLQELDGQRAALFLEAVGKRGQLVVATAHKESLPEMLLKSGQIFQIKSGKAELWSKV